MQAMFDNALSFLEMVPSCAFTLPESSLDIKVNRHSNKEATSVVWQVLTSVSMFQKTVTPWHWQQETYFYILQSDNKRHKTENGSVNNMAIHR